MVIRRISFNFLALLQQVSLFLKNKHFRLSQYSNQKTMTIYFWLFFFWSFPLTYFRSRFRKLVYQTEDWTINIKPWFWKELRGLFGNLYPENPEYLRLRNFYRFYLFIYVVLFVLWRYM